MPSRCSGDRLRNDERTWSRLFVAATGVGMHAGTGALVLVSHAQADPGLPLFEIAIDAFVGPGSMPLTASLATSGIFPPQGLSRRRITLAPWGYRCEVLHSSP